MEIDWWFKFVYCKETDIDDNNDEDLKSKEWLAKWPYVNIWKKSKAKHLFNCEEGKMANINYGQFINLKLWITP